MLVVIGSSDRYLGSNIARIVTEEGFRSVRTADFERVTRDLKRPGRMAVIDVNWEAVKQPGVLKQLVNISRISGNKVICISPNQDEELKALSRRALPDENFIRYDLEGPFREFLKAARLSKG